MKQAKAAFAFTARNDTEISFDVGDVILILEEDPSGWGKGRTKEYREGFFPLAYVQVEDLSDSDDEETETPSQLMQCIALYDFSALSDLQISFLKGDVISIIKKGSDNDWWEGILERTKQKGLFPSNYVKIRDQNDTQIVQTSEPRAEEVKQQPNNFKEPVPNATKGGETQYKISEHVDSKQHKKAGGVSDFRVEDSFETDPGPVFAVTASVPKAKSPNTSVQFSTNLSPLDVSVPFELHTGNYHREFATLSPVSPNLSTLAYDSAEMARRRHSMNISAASPLALSALGGEYTRDLEALCLLYPFVPSSVSHSAGPPSQPLITPTKLLTNTHPTLISPPPSTDTATQSTSRPIPIPSPHQIPQLRPQSAPQTITPTTRVRQAAPQPNPSAQSSSTPPKPVVPKLPLTSSPDRKEGYSNRDQRERNNVSASASASASTQAPSSTNGTGAKTPGRAPNKYGAVKSPGARRDASSGVGAGKRKVKLEASLSLGKKPNSTITHSNSTEQVQDANQVSGVKEEKQQVQSHLSEVEYLKKILHQEVDLRTHLESVVHDAHGKMNSASQYIKDLKAELFQAHMDISQLRVTNRQLNEQLDKFQLVTRVSVNTQTERDENIDKIRALTEQIHELEASTESLNEQIATLKNRPADRSPRNVERSPRNMDRSPRNDRSGNQSYGEMSVGEVRVDYDAVKQQFARVRECLLLEKDLKDQLFVQKTQAQEKLQKTEQQSKQIRRKLLTELQLKSDLNVRNQHIELQMQKLKEELATYKHRAPN